ncbi:MAG: hypothetical protein KatS3mg044_0024 [Rhodothermaceae bacterium]|nr:MAG: hypothetical protein KatS3mg044_0024 [Rhodothermaceae bacterium]
MRNKAWLVFGKEMRMLWRDRRLVLSVGIISLVVLPFLMGFIGNIDRLTGGDAALVRVVVPEPDSVLVEALSQLSGVAVVYGPTGGGGPTLRVERQGRTYWLYGEGTEERILEAARRVRERLDVLRERDVAEALVRRGLDPSILHPFTVRFVDTAGSGRRSGQMLGVLIPYLAIILLVSNANRAMYIAVGEKEKNTLASLLVTNAPRHAIVVGKILAIMVFAVVSSLLLVAGMLLFARFGFSLGGMPEDVRYVLTAGQGVHLVVNLAGLALFIAALIMLLGTLARSAREANIYTTPLLFLTIFLAVFSFASTDFGAGAYLVPVLGNALAMRDTFLGEGTYARLLLVVASNLLLFGVLVALTVYLYGRERVLFRD